MAAGDVPDDFSDAGSDDFRMNVQRNAADSKVFLKQDKVKPCCAIM